MKKRALFSLHDLDKVEEFAAVLLDLGWEIIASRETCNILSKKGIPVTDIAEFTGVKENYGFPPTLHPKVESYLTSRKGPRIDLVYVINYPLSVGNDVGGRALLALAVKGGRIPLICIAAKHGNACGMSISWDSAREAVEKALFGNPTAVWGGELIVNFNINAGIANILLKSRKRQGIAKESNWMLDVILAPGFTKEALRILGQRKQRKLLENKMLTSAELPSSKYAYRFIRGGVLRQVPHNYILDFKRAEVSNGLLSNADKDSLIIAWAVAWSCSHGGNEIALASDAQLIGAGGGPSTIEAALAATARALRCGHNLRGAVFAANAFFPFVDAPAVLTGAGVKAGLVPCGGKYMDSVKEFFRKKAVNMVYLAERFRGFSRH